MDASCVSQAVRLIKNLPDHGLEAGAVGIVCSVWCRPFDMFEVEFEQAESHDIVRALVTANEIEVCDESELHECHLARA